MHLPKGRNSQHFCQAAQPRKLTPRCQRPRTSWRRDSGLFASVLLTPPVWASRGTLKSSVCRGRPAYSSLSCSTRQEAWARPYDSVHCERRYYYRSFSIVGSPRRTVGLRYSIVGSPRRTVGLRCTIVGSPRRTVGL